MQVLINRDQHALALAELKIGAIGEEDALLEAAVLHLVAARVLVRLSAPAQCAPICIMLLVQRSNALRGTMLAPAACAFPDNCMGLPHCMRQAAKAAHM
jgi:hypothetical protein